MPATLLASTWARWNADSSVSVTNAQTGQGGMIDTSGAGILIACIATSNARVNLQDNYPDNFTDTYGNEWLAANPNVSGPHYPDPYSTGGFDQQKLVIIYALNPTTGPNHVFSVNHGAGNVYQLPAFVIEAWSGIDYELLLDTGAGDSSTTDTIQPGSLTAPAGSILAVCGVTTYYAQVSSATIDLAFSVDAFVQGVGPPTPPLYFSVGCGLAYLVDPGSGSFNPTWTTNTNSDGLASEFVLFAYVDAAPSSTETARGLLVGSNHSLNGVDNLISGQTNSIDGKSSFAFGVTGHINADYAGMIALDGSPHTNSTDRTLAIYADSVDVIGALTLNGVPVIGSGTVTNTGTLTADQLILGNGGVDIKPLGAAGTTTTVLHGNASGSPAFGAVVLSTDVSGDLPLSNLTPSSAASRLLGRGSASGAGDFQEISVGSGLSMSGTTLSASGGGSSFPAGSDTQVQYNDGGVGGADANLTWNKTAKKLAIASASGLTISVTNGTVTGGVYQDTNALTFGTTTSHDVGFFTSNGSTTLVLRDSGGVRINRGAVSALTRAGAYLQLGSGESGTNDFWAITFGYQPGANTNVPAAIAFKETSDTGETKGTLRFYTRNVTTDTAPTERLRIETTGETVFSGAAQLQSVAFSGLPSSPATGMLMVVTDSTTATWGATITGSGSNVVLAFYNGANWTVAGV